jgi:hypothetical protein
MNHIAERVRGVVKPCRRGILDQLGAQIIGDQG